LAVIAPDGQKLVLSTYLGGRYEDGLGGIALDADGKPDSSFAVTIYARNSIPVRKFQIPITYASALSLNLDSISTAGCRTSYFDTCRISHFDPANYRATLSVYNLELGTSDLDTGYGPILKVYFTIPGYSPLDSTCNLSFESYMTYIPTFFTVYRDYSPMLKSGTVGIAYVCGDASGNGVVNSLDITFLINALYKGGPAPNPRNAGNANGLGGVNSLDITYLINYLYKHGPAPICP